MSYLTRPLAILASVLAIYSSHAKAASSEWHDLGGGKARLVANLNPQTNVISGVLEVDLKPGWSTYWRYPGGSGIPPRFEFSRSTGIRIGEVKFPTPRLISHAAGASDVNGRGDDSGVGARGGYAGYKKKVLFPFSGELLTTSSATIQLDLLMGLCETICIPAQANMKIDTGALLQSDPMAVQLVSFSKLFLPKKMSAKDIVLDFKSIDENTLSVTTKHSKKNGKPALFVEGPSQWYLTPAKLMHQEEDHAVFHVDVSDAPDDLEVLTEKLQLTLATGSKGIEIQR